MNTVIATITKELLLLIRDRAGLLLLFLMPLLLIVIMALLQDAPFKDYQELRFDVLVVDEDKGDLATKIKTDIGKSKQYHVIDSLNSQSLTWPVASALVEDGTYKTAILIPEKATAVLKKKSAKSANDLVKEMGLQPTEPSSTLNSTPDSSNITLYFDPAAKRTFKNAIYYSLQRIITQSEMQMMLDYMISDSDSVTRHFDISKLQAINIVEQSTNADLEQGLVSNSVQHNVPAWAIFAIFFIIIPVAGQIISERQEGTLQRLKLIPGRYIWIQLGKVLSYMLVNIVQFYTMLLAGKTIMPLIGLPTLQVGSHPFALFTMVCFISFAASSFALFTGTVFKTVNQALPFGATAVVILSALGGIWIPTEAMPPLLQQIANLSPLHWALEGINDLLLRGMGIIQILPTATMLLLFGVIMLIFSYFYEHNTQNS
jgi:ABC-2 type transport system permease protein